MKPGKYTAELVRTDNEIGRERHLYRVIGPTRHRVYASRTADGDTALFACNNHEVTCWRKMVGSEWCHRSSIGRSMRRYLRAIGAGGRRYG